jgi:iron complex outermembrane receptor protein
MSLWRSALLGATAIVAIAPAGQTLAQAAGPPAAPAPSAEGSTISEVVVTARRVSESLQTVPVAVTVLTPKVFATAGVFTPEDLTYVTPGLSVGAAIGDRNNVIYEIRGEGFEFATLFPAVTTYYSEVPTTQFGTGQFFDLGDIQVLRGPQGVLFGRVTDGGNIMVTPQHPKDSVGGYLQVGYGNYNYNEYQGAFNLPIASDKLLFRAAFDVNRRDGFTKDVDNGQDLDNVAYEAFRLSLLWRPTSWFENYTTFQYHNTHDNGTSVLLDGINTAAFATNAATVGLFPGVYGIQPNGNITPFVAGETPLTPASYLASLQQQVARGKALGPREEAVDTLSYDRRHNLYLVNTTSIDVTPDIQLKNIFGYTSVREFASENFTGGNGAAFLTCHSNCGDGADYPYNSQDQYSEELKVSGKSLDHKLTWTVGTYWDYQLPGQIYENDDITLGVLRRDSVSLPQTKSAAGYGYAEYDASNFVPGLKFNGGVRYTQDKNNTIEATYLTPLSAPNLVPVLTSEFGPALAAATTQPIPYGQCRNFGAVDGASSLLGAVTCQHIHSKFTALTYTGGASYTLPSGQLIYAKYSTGYRPGGVNGASADNTGLTYLPEHDASIEVGLKADWRIGDIPLRTNIAVYHDHYTDIQKSVTLLFDSILSLVIENVPGANIQGVEFEGTLIPVRNLTLGLNADFTDAHYAPNKTSGTPGDPCNGNLPVNLGFCAGNDFPFTPRYSISFNPNWVLPIDERFGTLSIGGRLYWQARDALSTGDALEPNVVESPYMLLDLNAEWDHPMGSSIDITFFAKNVTNKVYRIGTNDVSDRAGLGLRADIYGPPTMYGVNIRYRFGGG